MSAAQHTKLRGEETESNWRPPILERRVGQAPRCETRNAPESPLPIRSKFQIRNLTTGEREYWLGGGALPWA
jgi:hypothetical protein